MSRPAASVGFDVSTFRRFDVSRSARRGLSLLELLLAMAITAMVAAAIAGMLGAVSAGVGSRKDNRTIMVLAHAAQSRLGAYFATARCVLVADAANVTLWLNDSRESQTIHATELRWLRFDADAGAVVVQYVDFPDEWSQTACELADLEYAANEDLEAVRTYYLNKGMLASRTLVDKLESAGVVLDKATALTSRHVGYELGFETENGNAVIVPISGTIRNYATPVS
jgi:prepilin-type N-terminal cleavage/methylation domain-containing protein